MIDERPRSYAPKIKERYRGIGIMIDTALPPWIAIASPHRNDRYRSMDDTPRIPPLAGTLSGPLSLLSEPSHYVM